MDTGYFNYRAYRATRPGERRRFLAHWWRFYASDPHWVPPYYPALRQAVGGPHVRRLDAQHVHLEALPRSERRQQQMPGPGHAFWQGSWEQPVATAALLDDRRQQATLLSLFRCANDRATLRTLLEQAAELSGARQLLGPVALSAYLGAGVLASHWSELAAIDTPYAPPYLAELMGAVMELVAESRLYHFAMNAPAAPARVGAAQLEPLDPLRLARDLLPLFATTLGEQSPFAPPDALEAAFLLEWWGRLLPLSGRLATVKGEPAGFVLLQPDGSRQLQRTMGGRALWRRLWLHLSDNRAGRGRVLAGGVLPNWRGEGIGQQLLHAAHESAAVAGWQSLLVGPVWEASHGSKFLDAAGGEARQSYQLFSWQARSESWW